MTPIVWPLGCFRFEPYNVAPRPGATETTLGMVTRRAQVYLENNELVSVEMILSAADEQTLRTFFKTTTVMGTQSFLVDLLMAGTLDQREATFYGAPPTFTPVAPGYVRSAFMFLTRPALTHICEVSGPTDTYEYQFVANTLPPDVEAPTFPVGGWLSGQGAFGFISTGNPFIPEYPINTAWPIDTGLWVRKSFTIDEAAVIFIRGSVENSALVYVNGELIQDTAPGNPNVAGSTINCSTSVSAGAVVVTVLALDDFADFGDDDNTYLQFSISRTCT